MMVFTIIGIIATAYCAILGVYVLCSGDFRVVRR